MLSMSLVEHSAPEQRLEDDRLMIGIGGPILEKLVVGKDDVKYRPFT